MRYFLAIIFPCLSQLSMGNIFSAIVCFLFQISIGGWIIAIIWTLLSVSEYKRKKQHRELLREIHRLSHNNFL
jgi:hypothetical protein